MAIDTEKLTKTLCEARAKARGVIQDLDDLGTCNFDAVFLPTGKGCQIGRKSAAVEQAIQAAGCSAFHKDYGTRRGYIISVGLGGQAATRTVAHETVMKHLESQGFKVSMWYQMD